MLTNNIINFEQLGPGCYTSSDCSETKQHVNPFHFQDKSKKNLHISDFSKVLIITA